MNIEKELIGKTITNAIVNGYEVVLIFDDNTVLDYEASDGGYSCYELRKIGETKWKNYIIELNYQTEQYYHIDLKGSTKPKTLWYATIFTDI